MKELRDIKSRYDFSLDNRQVVLIVSGLILVLMLSFLMGTLFGRNLARMSDQPAPIAAAESGQDNLANPSPNPAVPTEQLSSLENDLAAAADSPESKAPANREELIQNLQNMKPPTGMPAAETETVEPAPPVMAKLDNANDSQPAAGGAEGPNRGLAAPAKAEAKKETLAKPMIPAGSYTIQLVSLPGKGEAEALVRELQSKKYEAFMLTVALPKGTFYRVRVGHYQDLNQAKKALAILQNREGKYYDAWITQ